MKQIFVISALICLLLIAVGGAGCSGTGTSEVDQYIKMLSSGNDEEAKQAAEELILMGDEAVKPLIAVFSSGDDTASLWAAVTLCEIKEPAVGPLLASLGEGDEASRNWAVNTLSCIGDPAVEPLIGAIASGNELRSESAQVALIKMGADVKPRLAVELNTGNWDTDTKIALQAVLQSIELTDKYVAIQAANATASAT